MSSGAGQARFRRHTQMGNRISWPFRHKIFPSAGGLLLYLLCYLSLLLKNSGLAEQPNFKMWMNKDGEVAPSVILRVQDGVTACGVLTGGLSHTLQNDTFRWRPAEEGQGTLTSIPQLGMTGEWNKKILEESQGMCFPEAYNLQLG